MKSIRSLAGVLQFFATALLVASFVVPASSSAFFDGIPFDGPWELIAFVVFLLGFASAENRKRLSNWFLGNSTKVKALIIVLLIGLNFARFNSAASDQHDGYFAACYKATYSPLFDLSCEKTYDGFLYDSTVTRYEKVIDFGQIAGYKPDTLSGSNWNFSFANDWPRFDVWPWIEGNIDIERFPFRAQWIGKLESGEDRKIGITYIGEGKVIVGENQVELPPSYSNSRTVFVNTDSRNRDLSIDYAFLDTRKVNENNGNSYAAMRVFDGVSGKLIKTAGPPLGVVLFGFLFDSVPLILIGFFVFNYRRKIYDSWRPLAVSAGLVIIALRFSDEVPLPSFAPLLFLTVIGIWGYVALFNPKLIYTVGIPTSVILAIERVHNFIVTRDGKFPGLDFSIFRVRGDDWLVYQGLARTILTEWSLRGGEDVYWGQPGFRYLVFISHLVLGDGDVLVAFFFASIFVASGLVFIRFASNRVNGQLIRTWAYVMAVLVVVLAISSRVIEAEYLGLSEYATWIIAIFVGSLLFKETIEQRWIVLGAALCGFCVFVRTNQLFGMAALVAIFAFAGFAKKSLKQVSFWAPFCVFGFMVLLPLFHNLYFGKVFVLLPQSAGANSDYSWAELFQVFSNGESRAKAIMKLREFTYTAYLNKGMGFSFTLAIVFWSFQMAWIISLTQVCRRKMRSLKNFAVIIWPLAFALPAIPYRLDAYYPRQVVMFNLALGLAAFAIFNKMHQLEKRSAAKGNEPSWDRNLDTTVVSPHSAL
jgi:hypothetical protein